MVSPKGHFPADPTQRRLTTVLADVTPEGRDQGGSVIEDAVDIGGPSIDRSTEQVNTSCFAVDGLAITQDGEERVSRHGRARGEGDSGVDDGDRPRLGVMESRGWEGRGQRR